MPVYAGGFIGMSHFRFSWPVAFNLYSGTFAKKDCRHWQCFISLLVKITLEIIASGKPNRGRRNVPGHIFGRTFIFIFRIGLGVGISTYTLEMRRFSILPFSLLFFHQCAEPPVFAIGLTTLLFELTRIALLFIYICLVRI